MSILSKLADSIIDDLKQNIKNGIIDHRIEAERFLEESVGASEYTFKPGKARKAGCRDCNHAYTVLSQMVQNRLSTLNLPF